MKPGDLVIHKQSGRRLTVKVTNASAMVLCAWMETNSRGDKVECSGAYGWEELRSPTPEEIANVPAPVAQVETEAETAVDDAEEAEIAATEPGPQQKRKGR